MAERIQRLAHWRQNRASAYLIRSPRKLLRAVVARLLGP
jgi:hypothetical protein